MYVSFVLSGWVDDCFGGLDNYYCEFGIDALVAILFTLVTIRCGLY